LLDSSIVHRGEAPYITEPPLRPEDVMSKAIRILLVDDHALLRAGLRALLSTESDLMIVGEAGSGEDAVKLAAEVRPDIVLMDLSMPGMGGLEATRQIAALDKGIRVLILTVHAEEEYLMPVLEAGGSGYVMKHSADSELLGAIRTVAEGNVFLYATGTRMLAQGFRAPKQAADQAVDPLSLLSDRETEVLRLTVEGYTSVEIGEMLQISPKTVDTYRQRFMDKLALHHRSELVRFALQRGLLTAAT
jgi:two-component system, NarL family, response regulator NreC